MSTAIQRRRGTTAQHATFTGLAGEITVDTDKKTAVVHDGVTVGGTPLATEEAVKAAQAAADAAARAFFGSSSTAADVAAKAVVCSGFGLSSGAVVYVTFDNKNTVAGALTLNVNGTGDVPVYNEYGAVSTTNPAFFPASQPIGFVYDAARNCWLYRYADVVRPVPGGTVITVATPANGANTPAAPADGEYNLYATTSSYDISLGLARIIGGATEAWVGTKVIPGILPPGVSMRVAKGDVLRVTYVAGADMHLRFIYDKGAI